MTNAFSVARPTGAWWEGFRQRVRLHVVFQPIVDLGSGAPIGYEVLGRATALDRSEDGADLPGPAHLLEVAYSRGCLVELEQSWRTLAIETIARQRPQHGVRYFLNVDPRVLEAPGFRSGLTREILTRHGLIPEQFVFELTEAGAALDTAKLVAVVRHYSDQGFGVAIDDVGAGYASLRALLQLRPNLLKLDRRVVAGVSHDGFRSALVRALAEFADRTGIELVAEGIETLADLRALIDLGVSLGQGYLVGRPAARPVPPPYDRVLDAIDAPLKASA